MDWENYVRDILQLLLGKVNINTLINSNIENDASKKEQS